jgi:hypothetical protein
MITIFEDLNVLLSCKEGKFVSFYKGKQTPKLKIWANKKKRPLHVFIVKAWSHNNYIKIVVHKLQLYVSINMSLINICEEF